MAGTLGLTVLFALAVILTLGRPRIDADGEARRLTLLIATGTLGAQALHFLEELATGFPARFPVLLGLEPWSPRLFVAFNVTWLVIWALAIFGLKARLVLALAPIWFLGLAGTLNLLAHAALVLRSGGYFPGALTSILVGTLGLLLLRSLAAVTAPPESGA